MRLTFVQLPGFATDWRRLGLTDVDLQALEADLMRTPNGGAVVRGTGGLRKVRFAPPSWHAGKSGATRICYAHFPKYAAIYLIIAYGKNQQGNLSPGQSRAVKSVLERIEQQLEGASDDA